MKVFISWSGEVSHEVAKVLRDWLETVNQKVEPWVSSMDIAKGSIWNAELNENIQQSSFGILVVTRENLSSKWLHFEAGALLKQWTDARVAPLIVGLKDREIEPPISQFQYTRINKDDMYKLVVDINKTLESNSLKERILEASFRANWVDFEKDLQPLEEKAMKLKSTSSNQSLPTEDDVLDNLVKSIRDMQRSIDLLRESHYSDSNIYGTDERSVYQSVMCKAMPETYYHLLNISRRLPGERMKDIDRYIAKKLKEMLIFEPKDFDTDMTRDEILLPSVKSKNRGGKP